MLLELKSVSCGYGSVPIFQNISFSVERGQTLCLLGPNGVGKTTLFKTTLGLLTPLAGNVFLSGENMSAWTAEERAQLLCMDEPTASLDFGNQVLVMNRIRTLSATGITVIMTTHAPSHAFYCADQTAVMGRDGVFFVGRTNDVITEERLEKLYGVTAKIVGYENVPESRTCVPLPPK